MSWLTDQLLQGAGVVKKPTKETAEASLKSQSKRIGTYHLKSKTEKLKYQIKLEETYKEIMQVPRSVSDIHREFIDRDFTLTLQAVSQYIHRKVTEKKVKITGHKIDVYGRQRRLYQWIDVSITNTDKSE